MEHISPAYVPDQFTYYVSRWPQVAETLNGPVWSMFLVLAGNLRLQNINKKGAELTPLL